MIRYFIRNGIAVSVLSMALLLFGVLALFSLPIQLTPDVSAPVLSVVTYYPGATPEDIEQDILIDQEQYLKSLPGLEKMISTASMGQAEIELEFGLETNQQENIVRINNALAQVPGYPENVDEPTIQTSRASEQPVAWISVRTRPDHPDPLDVQVMFDYVEDFVKPYFERLTGISSVRGVYGGTERQMQVMIDPTKLADRGVAISKVREAIRSRNRDVSGGDLDEGKRRFNVRTVGRYESAADNRKHDYRYAGRYARLPARRRLCPPGARREADPDPPEHRARPGLRPTAQARHEPPGGHGAGTGCHSRLE